MALTLKENNAYYCTFNLTDKDDNTVSLASLGTFQMTQYYLNTRLTINDRYHGRYINDRQNQNVKNTNNVVVSAAGTVVWYVQPDDTAKLNQKTAQEVHVIRFEWYFGLPDGSRGRNSNEAFVYIEANAGNI